MMVCANCGQENPEGARFCNGCGAPLQRAAALREERKVVTVVFADLVGSTARAERLDPEDVRALLSSYHARTRQELEAYGGTVEKFIGDAVVAVFGAPAAHEDDPERAVRSALAVQEAIAELNEAEPALELEVRIGVNTGEALVAIEARPEAGEGMVSGDVINTAARLQSAAPPGGILVGEQTYRATERRIDYVEHEAVQAKGKAEPLTAWLALQRRSSYGLEHGDASRAALVGRTRELALLAEALARVRSDERPQLITLVGVPGIGKSRLVHELWQLVEAAPDFITWRRGRCLPYGEGVAYWALGEIVKGQAGILESDSADTAAAKLARVAADLLPEQVEAAWVERHLRPLVGLPTPDADPSRDEAFAARRRFLEALAEQRPAVIVFEDLHWADDDLLDFVDELTDRLDAVPLLLVCTARPELMVRRPGWGGGKTNSLTLSLAPLTDGETAQLLQALLDRAVLPAETQSALVSRAEGVPLFAEEYARMLASGGDSAELPETLHGIVAARIDRLPPPDKALLQDAAVLGKVFWADALGSLSDIGPAELDERLHGLERQEFVRRERRSAVEGTRQYVFMHALVREAAYAQMPRAARGERHRRAAEWIAALPVDRAEDRAEMLAHHLEAAISYGEATGLAVDDLRPAAVAALREAGDRAWALNVIGRATHLYGRAIDASPGEPDAELQFLHARALMFAEGIRDDARLLRQAIDGLLAAGKNELAAMALVTLDRQLWRRSAPEAGLLERALELVAEAGPTTTRGRVLATVAARWTIGGRPREALPLAEEAVSIARANGNPSAEAEALSSLSVALTGADDLVRGAETARHALELALLCGSGDAGRCYANAATFDLELGNVERAAELHREGLALMQRLGNQVYGEWLAAEVALDNYDLGAWDEAVRDARAQLSAREKLGTPHYMDGMLRLVEVAMTYAREGHLSTERVAVSLDAYRAIGDPQALGPTLAESAELLAFAGHAGAASELLDEYLEMRSRGRQSPGPWTVRGVLAWLLVRSEPVPDELFSGSPVPWTHAAAAIRDGDLANAADRLESIGARTVAAEVRFHAARSLTQTDTTEAARLLELAAAFWRSVGATARLATVEEVGAELRAAAS